MKTVTVTSYANCGPIDRLWSALHSNPAVSAPPISPSIDGTYALAERVTTNGAVLRPPSIVALYTNADGRST